MLGFDGAPWLLEAFVVGVPDCRDPPDPSFGWPVFDGVDFAVADLLVRAVAALVVLLAARPTHAICFGDLGMRTFQLLMLFAAVGALPRRAAWLISDAAPLPWLKLPGPDGRDELLQRSGDVVVVAVLLLGDHAAKLVHKRVLDIVDRQALAREESASGLCEDHVPEPRVRTWVRRSPEKVIAEGLGQDVEQIVLHLVL